MALTAQLMNFQYNTLELVPSPDLFNMEQSSDNIQANNFLMNSSAALINLNLKIIFIMVLLLTTEQGTSQPI